MPSALATASIENADAPRNPKPKPPIIGPLGNAGPTAPLPPLPPFSPRTPSRGRHRERVVHDVRDVGLRRPRPSRRSRLALRRSASFATSAIVVFPSLNFCRRSAVDSLSALAAASSTSFAAPTRRPNIRCTWRRRVGADARLGGGRRRSASSTRPTAPGCRSPRPPPHPRRPPPPPRPPRPSVGRSSCPLSMRAEPGGSATRIGDQPGKHLGSAVDICPGQAPTPEFLSGRAQLGHSVRCDHSHVADTRVLVVDDEANITDLVATALRYEGFDVEVAGQRHRRAPLGGDVPARPRRARRDAPRPRRLRGREATPRRRPPRAGRVPDRPRLDRGEGQGPHRRRRRLRHQAVQPRGADRPGPRRAAPHRQRRARVARASSSPTSSSTTTPTRCGAAARASS